jgi:hypothetical protein
MTNHQLYDINDLYPNSSYNRTAFETVATTYLTADNIATLQKHMPNRTARECLHTIPVYSAARNISPKILPRTEFVSVTKRGIIIRNLNECSERELGTLGRRLSGLLQDGGARCTTYIDWTSNGTEKIAGGNLQRMEFVALTPDEWAEYKYNWVAKRYHKTPTTASLVLTNARVYPKDYQLPPESTYKRVYAPYHILPADVAPTHTDATYGAILMASTLMFTEAEVHMLKRFLPNTHCALYLDSTTYLAMRRASDAPIIGRIDVAESRAQNQLVAQPNQELVHMVRGNEILGVLDLATRVLHPRFATIGDCNVVTSVLQRLANPDHAVAVAEVKRLIRHSLRCVICNSVVPPSAGLWHRSDNCMKTAAEYLGLANANELELTNSILEILAAVAASATGTVPVATEALNNPIIVESTKQQSVMIQPMNPFKEATASVIESSSLAKLLIPPPPDSGKSNPISIAVIQLNNEVATPQSPPPPPPIIPTSKLIIPPPPPPPPMSPIGDLMSVPPPTQEYIPQMDNSSSGDDDDNGGGMGLEIVGNNDHEDEPVPPVIPTTTVTITTTTEPKRIMAYAPPAPLQPKNPIRPQTMPAFQNQMGEIIHREALPNQITQPISMKYREKGNLGRWTQRRLDLITQIAKAYVPQVIPTTLTQEQMMQQSPAYRRMMSAQSTTTTTTTTTKK